MRPWVHSDEKAKEEIAKRESLIQSLIAEANEKRSLKDHIQEKALLQKVERLCIFGEDNLIPTILNEDKDREMQREIKARIDELNQIMA